MRFSLAQPHAQVNVIRSVLFTVQWLIVISQGDFLLPG